MRDAKGFYPIPDLGPNIKFPSVTTIQGILDKPWLSPWRIDMDVDYLFYNSIGPFIAGDMTLEQFQEIDFPKLVSDAKLYHKDVSGEAKDFGSRLHAALDNWHRDGLTPVYPELIDAFNSVIEWEERVCLKTIESEGVVWSETFRYAGTLDHYAEIRLNADRIKGVLDYKARNGKNGKPITVYHTDKQQIAAYIMAKEERLGETLDYGGIVCVNRETNGVEPHIYMRKELIRYQLEFIELCRYYHATRRK